MRLTQTCKKCASTFQITDGDLAFYERISPTFEGKKYNLLPPQLCPPCREQRRWAFRNQSKLYKRKCDFSGEPMISLYSQDKPYKVYKEEIWWSDKWDPLSYGRDFVFSRPFFEQFSELLHAVPRRGMHQDGTNENSEYTTFGSSNKNCYYSFACFHCENSYYDTICAMLRDSSDCFACTECELIYECTDCKKCYNISYCSDCQNCTDSFLLEDCRDCTNCIACKNLRKKSYHIYNEPVTKEEFEKARTNLYANLEEKIKKFDELKLKLPNAPSHITLSEDCDGDYIEHAKNCHSCFNILLGAQDCKYCSWSGWQSKDLMDCCMCGGGNTELVYEGQAIGNTSACAFINFCRNSNDAYYCDCISSCHHCFGCSGLKHKSYCILNKQYTKEEYEKIVPQIIEHMKKTGEWGEYFPIEISPFEYKETVAQEYFPL